VSFYGPQNHVQLPYGSVHTFFRQNRGAGDGFPSVLSSVTSTTGTGTATHTISFGGTAVYGELLLIFINANAGSNRTITAPSGWTQIYLDGDGTTLIAACYSKVSDGSEGSSIDVTFSSTTTARHGGYRIGSYQGTPETVARATGTSAAPNSPSLSPSWGSAKTLWISSYHSQGAMGDEASVVAPSSYTGLITSAGSSARFASSWRKNETATEDPGAYSTAASDAWRASTVAVRPA
jgi:hypothetical protein